MDITGKEETLKVSKLMAKEFLEYRLGVPATPHNVLCFAEHIIQFEKKLERGDLSSSSDNLSESQPNSVHCFDLSSISVRGKCYA